MTVARWGSEDSPQSSSIRAALRAAAGYMQVAIADDSAARLDRFVRVLLLWRERMSLVSQRTAQEIISKHVEDSLAIVPLIQPGWRIADLGSGAGFPGIVIALMQPNAQVLLVESRQRRVSFLRAAARAAGAANIEVVGERAEALIAAGHFHGGVDLVVSRAVWKPDALAALALPLLRPGGLLVAMAGPRAAMLKCRGYENWAIRSYRLSGGECRRLLITRKCST